MVVHSAQVYIQLKPLFSRHNGIGVQFTDEPTGNLDEEMAKEITLILKESAHTHGKCVIVVTHSLELASEADIVISLKNGKLVNKQRE